MNQFFSVYGVAIVGILSAAFIAVVWIVRPDILVFVIPGKGRFRMERARSEDDEKQKPEA